MEQETGMGLCSVAAIAGVFLAGIAAMLYFVAPDQARRIVQDSWEKLTKQVDRFTPPTTQPAERMATASPATQPVAADPPIAAAPPPVIPPPPPKPKAVLVLDGKKDSTPTRQQGWTETRGGKRTLVMERPKKTSPTTRPAERKPVMRHEKAEIRPPQGEPPRRTLLRRPDAGPASDDRNVRVAAAGRD